MEREMRFPDDMPSDQLTGQPTAPGLTESHKRLKCQPGCKESCVRHFSLWLQKNKNQQWQLKQTSADPTKTQVHAEPKKATQ